MKLKRLKFNYVAVKELDADRKTPGGIVMPDTVEADLRTGVVVAVGPGRYEYGQFIEPCVQEGDHVFFSRHSAGVTFQESDVEWIIFRDSEIYGTISD